MKKIIQDVKVGSDKQIKIFKAEDNITITHYGVPNFHAWAKKMIDVSEDMEFTKMG